MTFLEYLETENYQRRRDQLACVSAGNRAYPDNLDLELADATLQGVLLEFIHLSARADD